jgi:hypothetical protein
MRFIAASFRPYRIAAISLSIAVLLMPAIWNGFPLIFADTGGYLERAFDGTLQLGRSALYGTFLAAGIPLQFWLNIFIHAALMLWILALVLRVNRLGDSPLLLGSLIIGLSALTSLPWYVGQLMPDIFLPLSVLALYLLAFSHGSLTRWEIGALVAIIAIAIAFHMTILGLMLALMFVLALLKRVAVRLRFPTPGLALPAAALVAGLVIAPMSNLAITGKFAFTPGGTTFLFGRLVQDGIVAQYLADHCPDETLRLCAYRDRLPTTADDWLWNYESPLHKLGWWRTFEPEAHRIIRESLAQYPGRHVIAALSATIQQFVQFKTGEGMRSHDNWHTESVFAMLAPRALERFRASRQQNDEFDFTLLNVVQIPLAWLSMAALVLLLSLKRKTLADQSSAALSAMCLIALLTNAAICGVFSNPNDRYQSRIIWLAPLAAIITLLSRRANNSTGYSGLSAASPSQASTVDYCRGSRPCLYIRTTRLGISSARPLLRPDLVAAAVA